MEPEIEPPQTKPGPTDSQTVEQCLGFLSRKDDTSRFVGLAMLSSLLTHLQDRAALVRCWEALDPRFLDRLLKSGAKKTPGEAKDMVELAVNVAHAFATLLPAAGENSALVARAPGLVRVLPECSPITTATILQTLLAFSAGRKGAEVLLGIPDLAPLVQAAVEQETAMQVLLHAFVNAGSVIVKEKLKLLLPELCAGIPNMGKPLRFQVLGFLSELLTRISPEHLPSDTAWVGSAYSGIDIVITSGHTSKERHHTAIISASLLHRYPPTLLFEHTTPVSAKGKNKSTPSSDKPFVYLFLQLVLIDIRASFPALMESLTAPSYGTTAHRLAASFDIIAAFLGYLVTVDSFVTFALTPDLLLKLRSDLSETFGLTLEFLRDRWDAAFAGAEGFEPGHQDKGTPLGLTWDTNLRGGLLGDPLVMASVRALSLWLREEESLRSEAGGMVDFFLGLWTRGSEAGVDYRMWVVGALEGVLEEDHGRAQFSKYGGWEVVWGDLKNVYSVRDSGEEEARLAISEARLLCEVVAVGGSCEEGRCREVCAMVDSRGLGRAGSELDAEVLKLASACLANVSRGARGRMVEEVRKVRGVAERLVTESLGEETLVLVLVAEVLGELEELEGPGGGT